MNPRTISPADIALAMKMNETELWMFARTLDQRFQPTRMQKISGKLREIDAPFKFTKKKLKLLHCFFQQQRAAHPIAYGGVRGKSCFKHARKHLGKKYVWTRDAKDCFPSITSNAFLIQMQKLGFRNATAKLLTMLCTVRGRIAQGSPVSNDALNLFFWSLDQFNSSSAGRQNITTGRVADDFVTTSNHKNSGDQFVKKLEANLEQLGITINEKKRRKARLQNRSREQLVHNIRVDRKNRTALSSDHHGKAIKSANAYVDACQRLQPGSLIGTAKLRESAVGYMYYSQQADISPAIHVRRQVALGDRIVANKLAKLNISAYKHKWWIMNRKRNEPRRIARVWNAKIETVSIVA